MPSDDDSNRRVPLGPVGRYVIANLEELRKARGLNYKQLAERLQALGRPIPTLGLSRIEKGDRRVDADDLVALALALEVNPSALLLPRNTRPDDEIELASGRPPEAASDAWAWADGARPLAAAGRSAIDWYSLADFARHARPQWSPPSALAARWGPADDGGPPDYFASADQPATRPIPVEEALEQPVATAIVTAEGRVLVGRRNDGKPPWTFIAGEVEPGESPADAAVREVKEETGLRVELSEVIGERDHPRTGRHMIYIAARPTHGTEIFVGDEDELAEVRWASLAEVDELMAAYGMFEPVHEYLAREIGEA
jgi:8-oxo-dGTP pyrophosphatase MutT (NUDIX family)/transcriptional regulator with XRE-family HTH domain